MTEKLFDEFMEATGQRDPSPSDASQGGEDSSSAQSASSDSSTTSEPEDSTGE